VWSKIQLPNIVAEIKHLCIKGVLSYFGIKKKLEILHFKILKANKEVNDQIIYNYFYKIFLEY
jgi:hypothetical protein